MTDLIGEMNDLRQEAQNWLVDVAAPFWSSRGRTYSGLFAERTTLDGKPDDTYFRTFVQARHIYSIATAGALGWNGPWRELIVETMKALITHAKRSDGFFVHRLDSQGSILDGRADLYDQAFIMFALGTVGGATGDAGYFDEAQALLGAIESNWAHPHSGFREGELVDASIRRQNPHMHLLEAFMALHEASDRQCFSDAATSIATLCRDRFIDPVSGALLEYFGDDWTPAAGDKGRIAEPGHCFEWAWLFERLARKGWQDAVTVSDQLTTFGRRHGLDINRGVAMNEVLTDGIVVDSQARLWPQTERLKVSVIRHHRSGAQEELQQAVDSWLGLKQYFLPENPALWRDKMTENGSFIQELVPGSSFYHIACAIREMSTLHT